MSTPEQRALLRQLNLKIDTFRLTDLLDELNAAEARATRAEAALRMVDAALARRTALEGYYDRYAMIEAACREAGKVAPLQVRIAELESQGRSS